MTFYSISILHTMSKFLLAYGYVVHFAYGSVDPRWCTILALFSCRPRRQQIHFPAWIDFGVSEAF